MGLLSLTITFSVAAFYTITINPIQPNQYVWKTRDVYNNNVDCNDHGFCVSNFILPNQEKNVAYGIQFIANPSVNITLIDVICGDNGLFMTYNFTGGNWTLAAGVWADSKYKNKHVSPLENVQNRICRFKKQEL